MLREGAPVTPDPSSSNWKPDKKVSDTCKAVHVDVRDESSYGTCLSIYFCKIWLTVLETTISHQAFSNQIL